MPRRVIAGDLIRDHQAKYEDRGTDIELATGQKVRVACPQLWPNEVLTRTAAGDVIGAVRALVGDANFAALEAEGVTANMVLDIVSQDTGASVPE